MLPALCISKCKPEMLYIVYELSLSFPTYFFEQEEKRISEREMIIAYRAQSKKQTKTLGACFSYVQNFRLKFH